jgi:hypothetical protein
MVLGVEFAAARNAGLDSGGLEEILKSQCRILKKYQTYLRYICHVKSASKSLSLKSTLM